MSGENPPFWKGPGAGTNGGDGKPVPVGKKIWMRGENGEFIHLSIFVLLSWFPWTIAVSAQLGMSQGMSLTDLTLGRWDGR